jgi:SH3-like domain-containing protein
MGYDENPIKKSVERTLKEECPLEPGREGDYICLGWHKLTLANGESYYIHDGGTGGSRSFIIFHQGRRKGAVILTNSAQSQDDLIDFVMKEWMQ